MFALVFGIQEGHQHDWSTPEIWALIVAGIAVMALFVFWQSRNTREPLVPLRLFRDRNFSLANVGITTMGFAITAMAIPLMLYAQLVRGLSPTGSALLLVPMALVTLALAPVVGKLTDTVHPRILTGAGFGLTVLSLVWLSRVMTPDSATWEILLPMALLGLGNAGVWAPLSATATRNLEMREAGAGAGVYNATRQFGAVLGAAAIAVLMDSRLSANLPGMGSAGSAEATGGQLPDAVQAPFSHAMAQSMLLPPAALLVGLMAVLFFAMPRHLKASV